MDANPVATCWDAEYAAGRYQHDPPVGFVKDILAAATQCQLRHGVYVGCGNGRNLVPLVDGGLDLIGLDVSAEAITQLQARRPERARSLIAGDLAALPAGACYELVIGTQVFQHGTREQAHRHVRRAARRVAPGGLFCIRVNATSTDLEQQHDVIERGRDGGFTVRYRSGPKAGLAIHFFAEHELRAAVGAGFTEVLPPRLHSTRRSAPARG